MEEPEPRPLAVGERRAVDLDPVRRPDDVAGEVSVRPFSLTRPSAIIRSASRREARPERAMRLAIRSPFSARLVRLSFLPRTPPLMPGLVINRRLRVSEAR